MNFNKSRCQFLFLLVLTISFSQFVVAQSCEPSGFMGRFEPGSNVTLTQACPTCTFLNITITDPNSEAVFSNIPMTSSNGIFSFGPNSTISSENGTYFVQGVSNLAEPFKSCYIVTRITTQIDTSESIIYVVLTISVFLLFLFSVWGAIGLPARNRRNEIGRVISVEYWKYPKIGFMFLAYAFFIWFINILLTLSTNLVSISQYQGFFVMIFNILMAGVYVAFIAMIWIFFVLAARDLKLVDLLTRGINPR